MSLCSDQKEDGESTSGSSEAKTDRYGFLLVNGDTNNDSSDDPCPELVRHREMKWISLMSQWDQVLEKKHSKIKAQCQKGIPASVRIKCWPLLCGAKQRKENNENLYKTLESSPGQQSWIDVIKRDTDRQFPFHEMFQSEDSFGQQGLLQVLKAYTEFRPDEGYCQAQGPVAAVLLMNMPMEEAFWCLVQISELYLPGYYSPLLEGVLFDAAILFSVLKRTCPAAYKHMQRQGVEPLMFATDWLMCLYSRHLPFNTLLRVWDLFFCNGVRVLFQVAVVLVRRCLGEARQRKECEGQMETLERLRSVRGCVQNEHADTFIQEVCSVPLSLAELQRQTEKQLEKWRKERPGSTFDPRSRCHGYHMIWEKGKEKEKENIKKERLGVNLSVSVMRSHSSLSPAILRKKWRKRGSKVETEDWEGRGFSKQDSDDEEKRRASVCGVAGELRARTDKTSQEFSTHLQKKCIVDPNTQRVAATETQSGPELLDQSDVVFEEEENDSTDTETRTSPSLKEDHLQPGQQEIEELRGIKTRQVEEKQVQTPSEDQDADISTPDQPEAGRQQEEEEDAINKLEEDTQENRNQQEEEIDNKHEEEVQPNTNTHEQEMKTAQQEAEVEVDDDTQEQKIHIGTCEQEQEIEINSKHEQEMQVVSIKQEEEIGTNSKEQEDDIHLGSTEDEAICKNNEKDQEIKAQSSEQKVEIQEQQEIKTSSMEQEVEILQENDSKANYGKKEVEILVVNDIKVNSSEQEVKILEENDIKANSIEQEVEILEENDIKANSIDQEVEILEENDIKVNSIDQEVEILEENDIKVNSSEQEVEILEENDIKVNSIDQEVEILEENDIKVNSSEQEVEILEENDIKVNSIDQEVEILEENDIKANSSEQEEETQCEGKQANSDNEEEIHKARLINEADVPQNEQQQQEEKIYVEQNLEKEEKMHSDVQTLEDQEDAEEQAASLKEEDHGIGESEINTDEREHSEKIQKEEQISDGRGENTEGKRSSNISTVDQEETEKAESSPCVQSETLMEHSGVSEMPKEPDPTQEERMKVNEASTPKHGEHDMTSGSSNPEPPRPDKEEDVEKGTNNTTVANPIKNSPPGSNPQLRLRRSSSSHTSYPTILSEDTFRDPHQCIKQESCPQTAKAEEPDVTKQTQTQSPIPKDPPERQKSDKPKRRGLFHRLRAEAPSKSTIPKIVIQDFSEGEEKLSSKERRRRRRMQERKEKEEEKERKKLEKELEKEKGRERKKPQTRGKSFQVLSKKHEDNDDVVSGRSGSQGVGPKRKSYSESYF
ncbi:neurofilament medium polypeptide [Silurus meridionalis]|uniref:neurofilament medium polypeptide n=1 Tax=Silurus meridionalis TaxID=175797 RepID=UPI001EECF026|nr:neurofilament medium polypeptide [Silurus meridionalis]